MTANPEDIQFPVVCHYKIITLDKPGIRQEIEKVFSDVNIRVEFVPGHHSEEGRYVTFNASVLIRSLELMRYIDRALKQIEGVKVVL